MTAALHLRRPPPSRSLVAAALALLVWGCGPGPGKPDPEPECSAAKACTDGLVCLEGACVACRLDRECARIERCHPLERRCVLRPCFGLECVQHEDCGLGDFCVQGLCLNPAQSHPDGCTVVSCADGPCNEDQRCHATNFVCEEDLGCANDAECGPLQRCNAAAGLCEAACTEESADEVCGLTRVCFEGRCVGCTEDAHCGTGLYCDGRTHLCESLFSCRSNRDCEVPLVCNARTRECTADPGPCRSNDDCAPDQACQTSTGKCLPAACPADRFEPNGSQAEAPALPVGTTVDLTLCEGRPDFFRLSLARGDRVQATLDAEPLIPLEVALLGTAGQVIARSESRVVQATAASAGDHAVKVSSADHYVRYGLRLFVSRGVPCDADPAEPNDDYLRAERIEAGDLFGRSICPGDRDWYTLDVPPGKTLRAELRSAPQDGALELHLYDSDGRTRLASSAQGREVETVSRSGFSGSRAYLLVQGTDSGVQNRYDLQVRLQ